MRFPLHVLVGLAALASAAAIAGEARAACAPARVSPGVSLLPDPWKAAARDLADASATPGQPWSCGGGEIEIALREGGATLTVVTEDGRVISREVTSPEEIVPLGEALLARPLPPPPPPDPPPPPAAAEPPKADAPAPPPAPRALVSAVIAPRYAGASRILFGSVAAALTVPFGAWGAGAWARYDGPAVVIGERRAGLQEICLGAAASRSFALGKVDLRAAVTPSIAVVTRDGGRDSPDEVRLSGRVGLDARAIFPITGPLRAVLAADVELSPRELAERAAPPKPTKEPPRSDFPSYTAGIGFGLEVALR